MYSSLWRYSHFDNKFNKSFKRNGHTDTYTPAKIINIHREHFILDEGLIKILVRKEMEIYFINHAL